MSKNTENYIIPLALVLDKHIEKEIHFLRLPSSLKEKLTRLEELSRNGQGGRGKFIREKHNLPLNSLKKLFTSYLSGVTDMKAVGYSTDDKRWLISVETINLEMVIKILKVWIDAFYIAETELDNKRKNDNKVKQYAEQVINELNVDCLTGCEYVERIILFDNGEVVDKDAYSLLPLIAVNEIVGTDVTVNGKKAKWMYSKKNEIVTDPLAYKDAKEQDYVSMAASFSVQTIPPFNKPYFNVKISSRRWVSKNESEKVPFYTDEKTVYTRINDIKLQAIHAKYDFKTKEFEWTYADKKSFCGMYGIENVVRFNDIICNPSQYMNGVAQNDYYVVFEYGMKDGKKQMHNQDAGISTMERREIFENIEGKLTMYSSGSEMALHEVGNDTITQIFFENDFSLKDEMKIKFKELVGGICENKKIVIEVCFSAGQEVLRNALVEKLNEHFADTKVEIRTVFVDTLTECLPCSDEKKSNNQEGCNARIQEIKELMGTVKEPTMSIVIIHGPEYYKLGGKVDSKVDPKNALRIGFANTGRLTQFVIAEKYLEKEKERLKNIETKKAINKNGKINKANAVNTSVKNTLLDAYRQMGIHNCLVESEKKTTLHNKVAVGIYVVNYKNLLNDIAVSPFPMIVSIDMVKHRIMVETELNILSKFSNKKEAVKRISCEYMEFPIKFRELLVNIGRSKRIIPSERFLSDWFEDLNDNLQYEIMMAADGTSRKVVEGITNKDIKECYDEQSGYVTKIGINGKLGFEIDLTDYDNIDLIRIRVNDEVPDYIPNANDAEEKFEESSGIYKYDTVYYSKDVRTRAEHKNTKQNTTKLEDNRVFTHRNIIEIYPMYISKRSKEIDCVRDIHNLRSSSIQYEAGKTVLPMPLHLAKLLEEYFIQYKSR